MTKLIECAPDVYKVEPSKVTPSKYISFFVKRQQGNLLFPCLASSSTFEDSWQDMQEMGGVAMQLLGDMHFATKQNDKLFDEFVAMTYCSVIEEPDVKRKVANVSAFPFERHEISPGVIVIPTPGHRPGAVSYLLKTGDENLLFAGDSIWHDGTKWIALASKKNRKVMRETLAALTEEEFSTMFVNSSVTNSVFKITFESAEAKNSFLEELAGELA